MATTFPRFLAASLMLRSAPAITCTTSPTFSFCIALLAPAFPRSGKGSEHLRRQRDNFHELASAQLAGHRAEDAGPDGLQVLVDEDRGVAVELNEAAIRAAELLLGADDDRLGHVALLHLGVRQRLADADHDDVADARIAPLGAAEHLDAKHL